MNFNSSLNGTDVNVTSHPAKSILVPDWVAGLELTWLVLSLIAVAVGNVIVICVIIRENSLHKSRYWFHFNLAVADLLQGIITIPTAAASLANKQFVSGDSWCRVQYSVLLMCFQATLFTLVDMGLERTHAILRPLHHNIVVTNTKTVVAIIVIWLVSFTLAATAHIPASFYPGDVNIDQGTIVCFVREFVSDEHLPKSFRGPNFVMQLLRLGLPVLCVVIILITYCIVFWEARKQQVHINNIPHQKPISIFKTKAFKTISIHILVFIILVATWVAHFMSSIGLKTKLENHNLGALITHEIFIVLFLTVPSFSNPLVYNFRSEEFRKAFRKLFRLSANFNYVASTSSKQNVPSISVTKEEKD